MSEIASKKRKRPAPPTVKSAASRRKKVEEELLRSKKELERIGSELALANSLLGATLESISEGILVIGRDGLVAFHNSVFQSMWGLDWKLLFKGAKGADLVEALAQRTTTPELFKILVDDAFLNAPSYSPSKFLLKDGRTFRVHLVVRSLRPGLTGLVLQFSDMTDEIRAQYEVLQASLFFEANQGMALVDAGIVVLKVNKAFSQITGYEANEVVGKSYSALRSGLHDEAFYREGRKKLDSTGEWEGELISRRKNGEIYVQWSQVRALKDERGAVAFYLISFNDMTPIKKAEAALVQSEKSLRDAQAIAKIGSWEWDLETDELRWSDQMYSIYGISPNVPPGELWQAFEKLLAPEDLISVREAARLAREEGRLQPLEHPIFLTDGKMKYVAISGEAVLDERGKAKTFRGICQDITERRFGEEEKKLSHEAIAAVSQGVIITDGEGNTIRVNRAFLRITGYEETEVLGRNCRFLQGPETSPETIFNIRSAILEAKSFSGEILNYQKDGTEFWNDLSITPIPGAEGKPSHFIGIVRDVSDRKRLDELLHRRQYEHLHLINSLPGPVARINQNLEYEFLNDKYVSVLGRSRYRSIGHTIEEVAGELAFVLQKPLFQEALEGRVVEYETRLVDTAGVQKVWLVTLIPDLDERNKISGFFKIYSDITEQKKAEEWLSKLNDTLEQKVAERTQSLEEAQEKLLSQERTVVLGHLAGSVAHELRNPLAIISNSVFYLKKIQPQADQKVRDYLEVILSETRTSNKIISDLLNFGSVHETEKREVTIRELVETSLERSILPAGVRLVVELGLEPPRVLVDRQHILQVMTNILINAKEAMNERGEIKITAQIQDWFVSLSIRDNGPGIPNENLSKIFEPLYTTKAKGIGLGLAVSRKLMLLNGGDLTVRSEPGSGTEFTLILPRKSLERSGAN